jgi:vacuolar-type H+-ATPase subunit H
MPLRAPAPHLPGTNVPPEHGGLAKPGRPTREGTPTTTQVLERIKSAEAEVETALERAREKRDATVTKARQDALRHIRNAEESAREKHQEVVTKSTSAARTTAQRLQADAEQEVAAMEKTFEERLEESKKRILAMFERALDAQD